MGSSVNYSIHYLWVFLYEIRIWSFKRLLKFGLVYSILADFAKFLLNFVWFWIFFLIHLFINYVDNFQADTPLPVWTLSRTPPPKVSTWFINSPLSPGSTHEILGVKAWHAGNIKSSNYTRKPSIWPPDKFLQFILKLQKSDIFLISLVVPVGQKKSSCT